MAHAGIYATSAQILAKAGKNADITAFSEAKINEACLEAEGTIHCISRKVFAVDITAYTAMPAGGKGILADIEACLVSIDIIEHNMQGIPATPFNSRIEAEDMVNILRDGALRGLSLIRDQKVVKFITDGA